jgi:hypothetical protein
VTISDRSELDDDCEIQRDKDSGTQSEGLPEIWKLAGFEGRPGNGDVLVMMKGAGARRAWYTEGGNCQPFSQEDPSSDGYWSRSPVPEFSALGSLRR